MSIRNFSTIKDILRFEGADKVAYWRRFAMLLTLAVVIATMGLVRNSSAVVIAAMLVAPLMTPILGIASSIVMGWVGRAVRLLLIVWTAAGLSVVVAWLIVWLSDFPRGIIVPSEVMNRTDPGAEDLVIALAAGVAGAYVQINRAEVSLLPGAAIGVSLVPPLASAGVLVYFGQFADAYEATLLFATNFGAIIFSACVVYVALGSGSFIWRGGRRGALFSLGFGATAAFLALVFVQLFTSTYFRYVETNTEAALARRVNEWAGEVPVEIIRVDVDAKNKKAGIWVIVDLPSDAQYAVASTSDLLPASLKKTPFRNIVREVLGDEYVIEIRYQTRIAWVVDLGSDTLMPAIRLGASVD